MALATGVIHPGDVPVVWGIVWDATFTFVALIVISLLLDEAGFFHWAALHIGRWGGGRGRLLFPLVILLGAAIAAVFANDGAVLLLTPIVLAILVRLDFKPAGLHGLHRRLRLRGRFDQPAAGDLEPRQHRQRQPLLHLVQPLRRRDGAGEPRLARGNAGSAVGCTTGATCRSPIRSPSWSRRVRRSATGSCSRQLSRFWRSCSAAYFITAPLGVHVSVVTGAGAALLLALAGRWYSGGRGRVIPIAKVLAGAPWQIVLFSLGMYLVVYGLKNAGLTDTLAQGLAWLGGHGPSVAAIGTGFAAAILSSVMNNMPSVLIGALAIQQAPDLPPLTRELMVYANVIGCDLGPKFTPIGSLATLLWLHVLGAKGQRITWGAYMKVGLVITPPVLLAALAALAIWLPYLGPQ